MYSDVVKDMRKKMDKSIDAFREDLMTIRAGRANPKLVEDLQFSYYGAMTPIKNAATITVPEARLLVIQPWDASALKEIERVIQASDLGITPSSDGKVIRLPFPELTEERRKVLVKDVKARAEEAKVSVRNIRRDAMDIIKKMEKNSEITEDDKHFAEDDIQEETDAATDEIDEITKKKEKELMEV